MINPELDETCQIFTTLFLMIVGQITAVWWVDSYIFLYNVDTISKRVIYVSHVAYVGGKEVKVRIFLVKLLIAF